MASVVALWLHARSLLIEQGYKRRLWAQINRRAKIFLAAPFFQVDAEKEIVIGDKVLEGNPRHGAGKVATPLKGGAWKKEPRLRLTREGSGRSRAIVTKSLQTHLRMLPQSVALKAWSQTEAG